LAGSEGWIPVPFCLNKNQVLEQAHAGLPFVRVVNKILPVVLNLKSIAEPNVHCILRFQRLSNPFPVDIAWLQPLLAFFWKFADYARGGCFGFLTWPYSRLGFQ